MISGCRIEAAGINKHCLSGFCAVFSEHDVFKTESQSWFSDLERDRR